MPRTRTLVIVPARSQADVSSEDFGTMRKQRCFARASGIRVARRRKGNRAARHVGRRRPRFLRRPFRRGARL